MTVFGRHQFCSTFITSDGKLFLEDRVPFRYVAYRDNSRHIVRAGETLFNLAGRYYAPIERAAGLWWIIADFQPNPIQDPTIVLVPGTALIIPSYRVVISEIFSPRRQLESGA